MEVRANAFLHHMVRNIAGLLIHVGQGAAPPALASEVLAARNRRLAPATAPAAGLYLWRVHYPPVFGLPDDSDIMPSPTGCPGGPTGIAMSWFEKIVPSRIKTERRVRSVPEGLWIKCPACDAVLYRAELERNLYVCPKCSHHMRMRARERLTRFLDVGSAVEIGANISPEDPLKFKDSKRYKDRLVAAQKTTGEKDALDCAGGAAARRAHRRLRIRILLPGWIDGLGGGRAIPPRRRSLHRG